MMMQSRHHGARCVHEAAARSAAVASPAAREMVLDNARMLPLMLDSGERDAPITCAQLAGLKPPVAIARGEKVRPFFRIIADAAARCLPAAQRIVVQDASHLWPAEDPLGFSRFVRQF
jgi:hypothetical protein